jgi:hypothetical protein
VVFPATVALATNIVYYMLPISSSIYIYRIAHTVGHTVSTWHKCRQTRCLLAASRQALTRSLCLRDWIAPTSTNTWYAVQEFIKVHGAFTPNKIQAQFSFLKKEYGGGSAYIALYLSKSWKLPRTSVSRRPPVRTWAPTTPILQILDARWIWIGVDHTVSWWWRRLISS